EPVVLDGSQFRLISPYESSHCALNYVSQDKATAVLYTYNLHPRYGANLANVLLQGLNPSAQYKVTEIYRMPGDNSHSEYEGKSFSGDYLMKVGLNVLSADNATSHVFKLEAQ
ncbi:MAG: GH36 C-terminal domain-containing protein, partial [Bacteroidales bacterium]|nr:GH36 C-terminal domain-containing protein [Bacteroidales bacterium]